MNTYFYFHFKNIRFFYSILNRNSPSFYASHSLFYLLCLCTVCPFLFFLLSFHLSLAISFPFSFCLFFFFFLKKNKNGSETQLLKKSMSFLLKYIKINVFFTITTFNLIKYLNFAIEVESSLILELKVV